MLKDGQITLSRNIKQKNGSSQSRHYSPQKRFFLHTVAPQALHTYYHYKQVSIAFPLNNFPT